MNLEGKRILITGGGTGIGLELARRLVERNRVVIAGRDQEKLDRARADTPKLEVARLDVTSETQARETVTQIAEELGGLDVLVNNAGSLRGYPLASPDADAKSNEDVQVNVVGVLRMTRVALPLLEASHEGAVVFVSSAVALAAVPGYVVYAATKAAVHSVARSLRAELALRGIRVFDVLPPVVDTGPMESVDIPKLSPAAVADAIVGGLRRDREEIRVAQVRQLALLARVLPGLADRLVTRALTQPDHTP